MSNISLVFSSVLIIIPLIISYKENLKLEKEIIISLFRAIIQLLIVGYILNSIFGFKNPIYTIGLVLIMIINAANNAKKRGEGNEKVFLISLISILVGTVVTLFILVISKAIKFTPSDVIPVAGMIISNSMIAIGISYRNLNNSFKNKREEIEVKLSLGADISLSAKDIIRESIKISILPTLDSAKTLGIVALPGMMTGLILAGTSPFMAIKFQIMVTFMILSSTSIATMLATYLAYKNFFNERKQIRANMV